MTAPLTSTAVTISAAAAERLAAIAPEGGLRIAVLGGGCSGFSYEMAIAEAPQPNDLVIERDGGRVFVDPDSLELLAGSQVDWVNELIGQSFKIKNPNAKSSCGCGVSFSV